MKALESDIVLVPQTAAQALAKFGRKASVAIGALEKLATSSNEAEARFAAEAILEIKR